jgi:hypothetical protein
MNKFEPTVTHYLNDILHIGAAKWVNFYI